MHAARIEQHIVDTNPNLCIQNGIKNWTLIQKHIAILENLCQGKLPRRNEIPQLLKQGLSNNKGLKNQERNLICENPRKETLIDNGIKFPKRSKLSHCTASSSFGSKQEQEDFMLATKMQNSLNQASKVTTQPTTAQNSYPSVNQQIQVFIPSGGSNWNQANFDSVVNNQQNSDIIQEAEAPLNMKQTVSLINSVSDASPSRIVTATAQATGRFV